MHSSRSFMGVMVDDDAVVLATTLFENAVKRFFRRRLCLKGVEPLTFALAMCAVHAGDGLKMVVVVDGGHRCK
eukprot:4973447-Pleurochrysis_carterae.AAC.1